MKPIDFILLALVAVVVLLALRRIRRNKGGCNCGGGVCNCGRPDCPGHKNRG